MESNRRGFLRGIVGALSALVAGRSANDDLDLTKPWKPPWYCWEDPLEDSKVKFTTYDVRVSYKAPPEMLDDMHDSMCRDLDNWAIKMQQLEADQMFMDGDDRRNHRP